MTRGSPAWAGIDLLLVLVNVPMWLPRVGGDRPP